MKRDELWRDPQGEEWRVSEVATITTDHAGTRPVYAWVRHVSGVTAKITAEEWPRWRRLAPDPLRGHRWALARGAHVVTYPADHPCPVSKGERFTISGAVLVVESIAQKLHTRPPVWQVTFSRIEADRPNLLRATPPARARRTPYDDLDADAVRRAAIDSAYTTSPVAAMSQEPESVGPDWRDTRAPERELERQEARRARMAQTAGEDEVDRAAARLKQVGRERLRAGHDVADLLADVMARLAREGRA